MTESSLEKETKILTKENNDLALNPNKSFQSSIASSFTMAEQQDIPTEDILALAVEWLRANRKCALITVIETWGSSPRPVGSQMLVSDEMNFAGSVSGGCVEGAVIEAAVSSINENHHQTLDFGISDLDAWQYGLACGGKMRALILPLTEEFIELSLLENLWARRNQGEAQIMVIDLDNGQSKIYHGDDEAPDYLLGDSKSAYMRSRNSDRSLLLNEKYFALNIAPPPLLLIIGAVHIAQELAPIAKRAGFDPIIIDPRRGFASLHRFPNVKLVHQWPDAAMGAMRLDRRAALVTMTHDPKLDDPALIAGLRLPLFYIGALGSKKTQASRVERMKEAGFSDQEIARIHGPVGLPINAMTAPEIAISILAELIKARRGG